jgi:hypothetical protein
MILSLLCGARQEQGDGCAGMKECTIGQVGPATAHGCPFGQRFLPQWTRVRFFL